MVHRSCVANASETPNNSSSCPYTLQVCLSFDCTPAQYMLVVCFFFFFNDYSSVSFFMNLTYLLCEMHRILNGSTQRNLSTFVFFIVIILIEKNITITTTRSPIILLQSSLYHLPCIIVIQQQQPCTHMNNVFEVVAQLKLCSSLSNWPIDLFPLIADYAIDPIKWSSTLCHRDYVLSDDHEVATVKAFSEWATIVSHQTFNR